MQKPNLIIRVHNYNKVSLGAILGACPTALLQQFSISTWASSEPRPDHLMQERSLIAYSFMQPHAAQVAQELTQTRHEFPLLEAIAGGAHASVCPEHAQQIGFDYVFSGEGEAFFAQFLDSWLENEASKGIHIWEAGKLSLDDYPGFSQYIDYLPPLEISRGCKFGCMFCGVPRLYKGTLRHRSLDSISSIILDYKRIKSRRKRIKFLASNAFAYGSDGRKPDPGALISLLETIRRTGIAEIHLGSFPSEVRPDFVTREIMEIVSPFLANKTIVMGVQTGNDCMLKKMNRQHSRADSLNAIALLREFGFIPHVDFIVGNPDECEQDQFELIEFMEQMVREFNIKIHLHAFMPLPGTPWQHKDQTPIHPEVKQRIRKLENLGVLDGWWENHIGYFRQQRK